MGGVVCIEHDSVIPEIPLSQAILKAMSARKSAGKAV
jgi:hypothetical protein